MQVTRAEWRLGNIVRRAMDQGRAATPIVDRLIATGIVPRTARTWEVVSVAQTGWIGTFSPLEAARKRRALEAHQQNWQAKKFMRRAARKFTGWDTGPQSKDGTR